MRVCPVLLDSRAPYLGRSSAPLSLLLTPVGEEPLLAHLHRELAAVADDPPLVVPTFLPPVGYQRAVEEVAPEVSVVPLEALAGRLELYQPSDRLLFLDARAFPASRLDPTLLTMDSSSEPPGARHLVALAGGPSGTEECVQLDAQGRLRRIQRFYDEITWPFSSAVVGTLLPVACALISRTLPFGSLWSLREALATRGIPSRDIPLADGVFDLSLEEGLLDLNERFILALAERADSREKCPLLRGRRGRIDASARFQGPVVVLDDVVVEAGATIVGPTLLGPDCRVARGAVVAQCLVGPGAVVPPGRTVRHRALFAGDGSAARRSTPALTASNVGSGRLSLRDEAVRRPLYRRLKPVLDLALAAVGVVLLMPFMLLIAALIKLESDGPILFADRRERDDGREFSCFKFRTMVVGAHRKQRALAARNQVDGPQFKMDADPRVTRVGRWLRIVGLDELPQVLNVLRGEMSLVGPRPSPFHENQICVPWREGRLSVRPGITGLWQVCRQDRARGDFHQWIEYDLLYVRNLSFWLDVKILVATVLTLGGKRRVPVSWIIPRRRLDT